MPELPDLEAFSASLQKKRKGAALKTITFSKRFRSGSDTGKLRRMLERKKLRKVYRDGKELRFMFDTRAILGMHLMLKGRLYWRDMEDKERPHTLITLTFSNGKILALADYQGMAKVFLNPAMAEVPDALDKSITASFWKERTQTKTRIKNLLVNQKIVRGIGNAYADEILWKAGIAPASVASKIPAAAVLRLSKAISTVLRQSVKAIANAEPGIIGGEIRDFLLIHNHNMKKSPGGAKIIKTISSGRPTYFTNEQTLYV